jgi:hypothetical protein
MHLVELLQAALYFRYVTMNKEDVQRQMSAFRSAKDVSREAGLRDVLRGDYEKMIADGMFEDEPPRFESIVMRLEALEKEINAA